MQAIVRYHEIALKGRNRPFFVAQLAVSLRRALADLPSVTVQPTASRILVRGDDAIGWPVLRERLERVFGVANFSQVHEAPIDTEIAGLKLAVGRALEGRTYQSFRITARRNWKAFPHESLWIERELGASVNAQTGWRVDLHQPELNLRVELLKDRIFFSLERLKGPGGLPAGSSGRVVALLSGGIDSPVAAWRLMQRGCRVTFVNCHAFPLQDRTMIDKVRALAERLTPWQYRSALWLVPFGKLQQTIVAHCPAPLRVVLYRRFMLRIAEQVALRSGAKALITGESVGQVASQTLDNLRAIDAAATLPVLRPLIGMDKQEITDQAEALGTFPISTLPDQDCCQLFVPRHPTLAAQLDEVLAAEAVLDVAALVAEALAGAELVRLRWPAVPVAAQPPPPVAAQLPAL